MYSDRLIKVNEIISEAEYKKLSKYQQGPEYCEKLKTEAEMLAAAPDAPEDPESKKK